MPAQTIAPSQPHRATFSSHIARLRSSSNAFSFADTATWLLRRALWHSTTTTKPTKPAIMPSKPDSKPTSKRFELPALDFKFSSLTEGTDIPPPEESPVEEEEEDPKLPTTANGNSKKEDGVNAKPETSSPISGSKRSAQDELPSSPTLSSRPGSVRRLFSRSRMNAAYANGEQQPEAGARPPSRSNNSLADSTKKAKRSSGWFSRFRSNASDDSGIVVNDASRRSSLPSPTEEKKPMGPPPPMIPELSELKSGLDLREEGTASFGSDLFKNIK